MKTLIMCPTCQQFGSKQTLAEVLPSGMLAVQRLHHGSYGKDYTVISGSDFQLLCGQCGQTAFLKQEIKVNLLSMWKVLYGTALGTVVATV